MSIDHIYTLLSGFPLHPNSLRALVLVLRTETGTDTYTDTGTDFEFLVVEEDSPMT